MGSKNEILKNNEEKYKEEKPKKDNKDIYLKIEKCEFKITDNSSPKIPNPIFKNKINFIDNYLNSSFEIFKLKNITEAFYIAFSTIDKKSLNICKFYYQNKKIEEIYYISNLNYSDKVIKYFYNPLENTEYLYILNCNVIYIFLIKKERHYELVRKINKPCDPYYHLYTINYFEIIHNKFNNNNYLITSSKFWNNQYYFEILNTNENKCKIMYSFPLSSYNFQIKFLLYEDRFNKKNYLLLKRNDCFEMIEIKDDYNYINEEVNFQNIIISNRDLKKYFSNNLYYYGKIIYDKEKDYLYLSNKISCLIIDLFKKEIVN